MGTGAFVAVGKPTVRLTHAHDFATGQVNFNIYKGRDDEYDLSNYRPAFVCFGTPLKMWAVAVGEVGVTRETLLIHRIFLF